LRVKEKNQNEDLAKIGTRLMRSGEFSSYERLLITYLIPSISAKPLKAICFTSSSAMMLKPDDAARLEIDMDTVETVYTVSHILDVPAPIPKSSSSEDIYFVNLASLDFSRYIAPWGKMGAYHHIVPAYGYKAEEYRKAEARGGPHFFVHSARLLVQAGLRHMQSDFIRWAYPQAQAWASAISSLVSPATYSEIYSMFTRGRTEERT
jgi:hypothetical protein